MLPNLLQATAGLPAPLPAFAHDEAFEHYFARLAQSAQPAASLRRLLSHVDADLTGAERLALWRAQWQAVQRMSAAERAAVAACLDGRHAGHVKHLAGAWEDSALVAHLAASAMAAPARPDAVQALFAHHGLQPLDRPADHEPHLVVLAAQAELAQAHKRLDGDAVWRLQHALADAATRDGAQTVAAMVGLFDLALHARDEDTASAILAELIAAGQGHALPPARVCDWLDGSSACDSLGDRLPLTLAASWQKQWLQPARWQHEAVLNQLARSLRRGGPLRRVHTVMVLLGSLPPLPGDPPRDPAWQALAALDTAYAMIESGLDALPALVPMIARDDLAVDAVAALHRGSASALSAGGDLEGAVRALARSRRLRADDGVRRRLHELLKALGCEAVAPLPDFGRDWRDEDSFWKALLQRADLPLQRLAAWTLARLWNDGSLEPGAPLKCQQLQGSRALWQWLALQPAYAADARSVLRRPTALAMLAALHEGPAGEHLWVDTPGAERLLIVFSCALSHHRFPEFASLAGRLPGHHLLFVRNPGFDWYSDESFDALVSLVRSDVLPRFAPVQVSCHYGSMGGHGALKLALEFGFRALVFNPQTDLDLWAAQRAGQRAQLWAAQRHARLDEWPTEAFERAPLYYACGCSSADREALSALIVRLRECRRLTAVVEKYADPHHSGLMNRISQGTVAGTLAQIDRRLDRLSADAPADGAQALDGDAAAAFWQQLDEARVTKVEIQLRDGRLWWQTSRSCGTR